FVVEDLMGGEAVAAFEGVFAGDELAFLGARPGGVLGVETVALGDAGEDVELGFGSGVGEEVLHDEGLLEIDLWAWPSVRMVRDEDWDRRKDFRSGLMAKEI